MRCLQRDWRRKSHARWREWGQDLWVVPVTSTPNCVHATVTLFCTHAPFRQPSVVTLETLERFLVFHALLFRAEWAQPVLLSLCPPVAGFLSQPLDRQTEVVRHCWTPSLALVPSGLVCCLYLSSVVLNIHFIERYLFMLLKYTDCALHAVRYWDVPK